MLPSYLKFHVLDHTSEVVSAVRILATKSGFSQEQLEIVVLSAWFHDTGYSVTPDNHEAESCELAGQFLSRNGYGLPQQQRVQDCILATKMPQDPVDVLQQVLCDADMAHLGLPFYWVKNSRLRQELETGLNHSFSDLQWYCQNLDFLKRHRYFTMYGKTVLERFKKINVAANLRLIEKNRTDLVELPARGVDELG